MRILSAAHGDKLHSFNIKDIDTQYQEVNVYYSSTDRGKIKPLIIGLVPFSGTPEYYTFDGKLKRGYAIRNDNLTKALDQENCLRKNIVVANLSKKGGRYCCGMNGHNKIQVHHHRTNVPNGYTSYLHLPTKVENFSFNIHKFKDDKEHVWPSSINSIRSVHAYFCNNNLSKALLLYVNKGSGSAWFRRTSGDGNTWTEAGMESLKTHTPSSLSIKQHIEGILHKLCKELSAKECKHADSATSVIPTTTTPAVSSGGAGTEGSVSSGSSSTPSSSQQEAAGAPGPTGPSGVGSAGGSNTTYGPAGTSGSGGGVTASTEQNTGQTFFDKATKFIKSRDGIITASVTPGIGGLIGAVVWKWPKIMSCLITKAL
ncbi:hypothetical protein BEWA_050350 [Theileria equi strain WA]|uniref:Uncharacterized protein n=1 Tax=Theileria equi strain WA TaxID=1537102 RepID=L1LAS3_THEEQ|nr:hypothetical protein BEWA_050350 [Theileria equi strain WA]EKX72567.1 hypothetical protein BEWA_050350 [Theileria equi strain WA]|eukprot:XP_004832019.1 hypothetical protein BEWA_050350 [Theileria equi strain WA]